MVKRYEKLVAWQKAHELVLSVYRLTKNFPTEEKYGLVSQLRRAVVSVSTNIVEGNARDSKGQFSHFLNIAKASLTETDYLLRLSLDLGYLQDDKGYQTQIQTIDETSRLIHGLWASLGSVLSPSVLSPSGLSPSGLSPSGLSPSGLSPSGLSPSGLSPSGLSS